MSGYEEAGRRFVSSDAEELREILSVVLEFIKELRGPIEELLGLLATAVDGKKIGEEVASMYEALKSRGVPEDMIKDVIKDFMKRKFEMIPDLRSIFEEFRRVARRISTDDVVSLLENLKRRRPDISKEIDTVIEALRSSR